jgi:uncharacterized protein (TIGR03067 family)
MHRRGVVALLAVLAVASFARGSEDKDGKAIQGTWLPMAAELAGQEFPAEVRKTIKLVIDGEKYTVTVGAAVDEGTIKLDSSKTPKTMTVTGTKGPNQGKTFPAIYELTGDSLKICYDLSGQAHPAEFKTKPGTQLYLVTYQRAKP